MHSMLTQNKVHRALHIIATMVVILTLVLALPGKALAQTAPPDLPSSFYGYIKETDFSPRVAAGDQVVAILNGVVSNPVTIRTVVVGDQTLLVYNMNVPGVAATDQNKPVIFKIKQGATVIDRVMATSIWETGVNHEVHFHPPAPVVSGSGVEGQEITLAASAVDGLTSDTFTFSYDCSNTGDPVYVASNKCTFPDQGTYSVRIKAVDSRGGEGFATGTVTVTNANPTATFTATSPVNEGVAIGLSLTGASDVPADTLSFAFDCGSGYGDASTTSTASCPTTDNGIRTVKGKVMDEDGGSTEYTQTVTINNVAPTATLVAPASVTEGSTIEFSLTNPQDVAADTITYAFACGTADYGTASTANSSTCAATDDGTVTVKAKVLDDDGGFTEYTKDVTVTNVAPTATFTAPATVAEGTAIALSLTAPVDPGADTFTYAFDCGSGTFGTAGAASTASCPTTDNGTKAVRGKIIDDNGGETIYSATVTVTNVAPSATFTATTPVDEGSAITLTLASPVDPGTADTFTYAFDCGSGTFGDATAANTATCPTTDNGSVTVRGKIIDDDLAETIYSATVTINDVAPSAVNAGGPYTVTAGGVLPALAPTYTCVSVDTCTVAWDLNNNTTFGETADNPVTAKWNTVGEYAITVKVTDDDGSFATGTATVNVTGTSHSITLQPGWNLVSFNVIPVNPAVSAVLSSVTNSYDIVYAYDATQTHSENPWLIADKSGMTEDDLTQITAKMGFWIHITSSVPVTLTVTGSVPTSTDIALSKTAGGWNLVGYPAADARLLPGVLSPNANLVFSFRANEPANPWKVFDRSAVMWANDLQSLSAGWGYWVYITADETWTVTYP